MHVVSSSALRTAPPSARNPETETIDTPRRPPTAIAATGPFSWRNYLAHSVEGGLYMGGQTFLAQETVLPAMVSFLGGPSWLVALMPMMTSLGFSWLPLLTAHRVERLDRVKPFVLFTGVFQRLPYVVAAVLLLTAWETMPRLVLCAVALAPFVSGAVGGVSYSAWIELVSRTIPEQRRASSWAIRFIICGALGIPAGTIISRVLSSYPGASGYGILHLIAFAFLVLSYLAISMVREAAPAVTEPRTPLRLAQNLSAIPALLRAEPKLADFTIGRTLATGFLVMVPFMSLHALRTLGKPESYLGVLVTSQMAGAIVGNLVAGYVGDRLGGRSLVVGSQFLYLIVAAIGLVNRSGPGFAVMFFTFGMALYMGLVGDFTLSIELCTPRRRPTYLSFLASVRFGTMLVAAALSAIIQETAGTLLPAAAIALFAQLGALYFFWRIPEPRALATARGRAVS